MKPEYLKTLTESEYEVNFNSARTGIRLNGPIPQWVREDGGEAGLHPSNIHDNAYAVGTLDLTGDQSILLGPDGPSPWRIRMFRDNGKRRDVEIRTASSGR